MSRIVCIAIALSLFVFSNTAYAQRDFSTVKIKTVPVANNIRMLVGAGGNIGLFSGKDGVFMIDDQFAPLTPNILAAIKKITPDPVRFLLNTHWHFDHSGGNKNMGEIGTTIIAHDNVRKLMSMPQELKAFGMKVPASPKIALPVMTFDSNTTIHLDGEIIKIRHLPNAHTDGDSFVQFVNANVFHAGDTFFNGFYPFIDTEHGGSISGMIEATNTILTFANDNTKIIPGHGPLGNKAQLKAFRNMLLKVEKLAIAARAQEQTSDELSATPPIKKIDATWGKGFLDIKKFLKIVYSGMKN
jgi:cyclase